MIFRGTPRKFESEKERNLYYKFFAGYYFNELIAGYEDRLKCFTTILKRGSYPSKSFLPDDFALAPDKTYVSFDNHPDRFGHTQTGEFADILIYDIQNSIMIGIEAKFLADWNFKKDIQRNTDKLASVNKDLKFSKVILCLLVTKEKWDNATVKLSQTGSNVKKLLDSDSRVIVIHWEDFLPFTSDQTVHAYLTYQLAANRP